MNVVPVDDSCFNTLVLFQFSDEFKNKFSEAFEIVFEILFWIKAFKLFWVEVRLVLVFRVGTLSTRRTFLSPVRYDKLPDFKSLNLYDKLLFCILDVRFVNGVLFAKSELSKFVLDHVLPRKLFFENLAQNEYLRGLLICFASDSALSRDDLSLYFKNCSKRGAFL